MSKKRFIFNTFLSASLLSLVSISTFSLPLCPCPGVCCPTKISQVNAQYIEENADSFSQIPEYLSPYTTSEKINQLVEEKLQQYRVK